MRIGTVSPDASNVTNAVTYYMGRPFYCNKACYMCLTALGWFTAGQQTLGNPAQEVNSESGWSSAQIERWPQARHIVY